MRPARRFWQAVAATTGQHILNTGFQINPVANRYVYRFYTPAGAQHSADKLPSVEERHIAAGILSWLVISTIRPRQRAAVPDFIQEAT